MAASDQPLAPGQRIARNTLVRTGGDLLAKLASLVFFVAVARTLGKGGFGNFTFALSLTTVLMLASGFGTDNLMARELARDPSRVHHYLTNVMAVKVFTSAGLLLAAVAVVTVAGYPGEVTLAVAIIGFGVALENFGKTWQSVFQAHERMEFISISLIIQRTLTSAAGLAVLAAGGRLIAVAVVFAVGAVVGLASAGWMLRRYIVSPRLRIDPSRWMPLIKAGIPIGLASLLFTVLLRVDATLIGFLDSSDPDEVGIYGAAFRLIEATMFLSWSFGAAVLPWFARQMEEAPLVRGYELGLKFMAAVLLPIGLGFILLADPLIRLLYGDGYQEAVLPLRLLGGMAVLYAINYFAGTTLTARDRPGSFARILTIAAAQNIVMNIALIPRYGAVGAAFTATLSGLLLAGLSIWQIDSIVGRISLTRTFAGPLAGGAAMTVAILATEMPLVPAGAIGLAAYAIGLLGFERLAFPGDLGALLAVVGRRGRLLGRALALPPAAPEPPGVTYEA